MQYGTRDQVMAVRAVNRLEQTLETETTGTPEPGGPVSMDAPVAAPSPTPMAQRRGKSDALWEAHKATIRRLYIDEGRSLKEVVEIMKTKHGFEASLKPYKARLNRWGFSKYITTRLEREALQHVVSNGLPTEGGAKPEIVRLSNGTMISLSSLVTHLDRKRSTPHLYPVHVLRSLRSPEGLWVSEEMLRSARDYIREQYTTLNDAELDMRASLPSHYGDFFKGLVAVRRLLQESRVDDALLVLRRAPEQIRMLLGGPTVNNAFGCICITVLCVKWDESRAEYMNATLRALLKFAASVVHETAGPDPLRRILTSLTKLDDSVFREAVIRTWKCQLQTWTEMRGSDWNVPLLGEWLAFGETAGYDQLPSNFEQGLRDTIRGHEVQYGRSSLPVVTLLWLYGEHSRLYAERTGTSTEKAKRIFLDLLDRGQDLDMLGKYTAQYFVAKEYRRDGDKVNAEKFLRGAIESLSSLEDRPCFGVSAALELVLDLERWLTEWGEYDKVEEIRQRRLRMRLAHEKKSS
ncbi:hypothetical protein SLS64_009136 [Diaporthe eres]